MRTARAGSAPRKRAAALLCAVAVAAIGGFAPGSSRADDEAPGAALTDARFTDHCLGKTIAAEAHYQSAIDGGALTPKERAEARFAIARGRALDGRPEAAAAILETLAREGSDAALGSFPARARLALDRLGKGLDPFAPDARGEGVHTIEATAKTLTAVLRDWGAKASLSFALDASCAERWTVSVSLVQQSLDELMDRIVGKGRWRRLPEGAIVIGDIAADGRAWERAFSWSTVTDPADRAAAARVCATRVTLTLNGTQLSKALASVRGLGVAPVTLAERLPERPVRVYARDLPLDRALDMIVVPLGCEWVIEEGAVHVRPRSARED